MAKTTRQKAYRTTREKASRYQKNQRYEYITVKEYLDLYDNPIMD